MDNPKSTSEKNTTEATNKKTQKKGTTGNVSKWILIIITIASLAYAGYSGYQLKKIKDPVFQQKLLDQETKKITNAVGKLIQLPEGTPQIATVSDVETLKKSQPFFENAQNGDQVLVFTKEAILYRPSNNKIINVAPVNREQAAPQPKAPETDLKKLDTKGNN